MKHSKQSRHGKLPQTARIPVLNDFIETARTRVPPRIPVIANRCIASTGETHSHCCCHGWTHGKTRFPNEKEECFRHSTCQPHSYTGGGGRTANARSYTCQCIPTVHTNSQVKNLHVKPAAANISFHGNNLHCLWPPCNFEALKKLEGRSIGTGRNHWPSTPHRCLPHVSCPLIKKIMGGRGTRVPHNYDKISIPEIYCRTACAYSKTNSWIQA